METFQILSRGGVRFDKKRFQSDVKLFRSKSDTSQTTPQNLQPGELPIELDFFKYAKGDKGKQKATDIAAEGHHNTLIGKKRKRDETDAVVESGPFAHRVVVKGNSVPSHAATFEAMQARYDLSTQLLQNLSRCNYVTPTGIQAYGCPILLESRDIAAISPTGTGKTLSYLLPIFSLLSGPCSRSNANCGLGVRAIILSPTRELAHQIHNECLKLAQGRKWRIVLFSKATAATLADKTVRDKIDIIVSTPLRLIASIQSSSLDLHNVRHLVLDEADRLLDSEFLPQIEEIVASCTHQALQKAVFSATLPAGVEKVAMAILNDPIRVVVGLKDTPLPLIVQSLIYVATEASKLPTLLTYLSSPYNPPILIFTSTQTRASSLHNELLLQGVPNVDVLHAGMTKKEREDCLKRMRKGDVWVLVSTEVMARGMDFVGIQGVINYDFPQSVQSYVHRIGRTGRAGREGIAVTYFTDEDGPFLKAIANVLLQSGSPVADWILKLPKPSKMKRRQMGKVQRGINVTAGENVGRSQAIKRREMIEGSKRRKLKAETEIHGGDDSEGSDASS